ncbi:MAG: hypothetical protein ACRYGR_04230 [Janthinobacterium lividum]
MFNFKSFLVLTSIFCLNICAASHQLTCDFDYKVTPNNKSAYNQHTDVERAGVVLCKDYRQDEPGKPNSRYAVILGHDRNTNTWSFQAGKCEAHHKYTSDVARDELYEETGTNIKLNSKQISQSPYIYHGKKQLFFVRYDQASVRDIKKSCLQTIQNPTLSKSFKEIDDVVAVSLIDLIQLGHNIKTNNIKQNTYTLRSKSQNRPIEIEGYYMRMIAYRIDEVKQIFNHLLPGARF